jgi:hypothetical protein
MATDEDKKQPGEDQPPPETILAEKQRDPDEAAFAEQAIQEYAAECLEQFRLSVETALDGFNAWISSQNTEQAFDNQGFFAQLGDAFVNQLLSACGGLDTPIGQALNDQIGGAMDQAMRDEAEISYFIVEMSRGARDFAWYLRDNLQTVLANQWDQLRDLAYEGSTDFIPAIHAFGLPSMSWNPADMQSALQSMAERFRESQPKTQEEAVDKDKPKEEEQQQEELMEEDAAKKAAS